MEEFLKNVLLLGCCLCMNFADAPAQQIKRLQMRGGRTEVSGQESRAVRPGKIVPIGEFVKLGAECYKGMFNVYVQEERYYVEMPESLMGRDIAAQQVLAKGSAQNVRASSQLLGYAGDPLAIRLIRFVKGGENEVWLVEPDGGVIMQDTTSDIYRLTRLVGKNPISMVFPIVARGKKSVLFDMTDALAADNNIFSLKDLKQTLGLGGFQADRSYVAGCSVFSDNVIFRMIKCYGAGASPKLSSFDRGPKNEVEQNPTMWELAVSLVLLPEEPMRVRYEDRRVGYFVEKCTDYDADPLRTEEVKFASRWRMEPKPEDVEKYKLGELVEPQKPIVFYVDDDIPEYLVPHLIAGVQDWLPAFERAGFKNAIQAKRMPKAGEKSDFSMDDARYSVISYKAAPFGNALGLRTSDPRTGEILSARISLLHCVQKLVQKWYFAQASIVDERAREFPFPEELTGRLVRYIVSHEVGHTLGLRHNYISSNTYTVEQIRNRNYVKKHGHTASIMDYARFNYVAQPEDKIALEDLVPRVGEYDLFAIEWGYRCFPGMKDAKEEQACLLSWTTRQLKENERRLFGTEYNPRDPRLQQEDLGDNNMKANELGIVNLKRIVKNMVVMADRENANYTMLADMYKGICDQYLMYMTHVVHNVGGVLTYDRLRSEGAGFKVPVGKKQQKEAMVFLDKHFFHAPDWLFEERLTTIARMNKVRVMRMLYGMLLKDMVGHFSYVLENESGGRNVYRLQEYADDLYQMIFKEVETGETVSPYRKELQRMYVKCLIGGMERDFRDNPVVTSVIFGQLERLKSDAEQVIRRGTDDVVKGYWEGLVGFEI